MFFRNYLFQRDNAEFSILDTIQDLIKFVDKVAVVGLQQERFNVLLTNFVLQFFEEVIYLLVLIAFNSCSKTILFSTHSKILLICCSTAHHHCLDY